MASKTLTLPIAILHPPILALSHTRLQSYMYFLYQRFQNCGSRTTGGYGGGPQDHNENIH